MRLLIQQLICSENSRADCIQNPGANLRPPERFSETAIIEGKFGKIGGGVRRRVIWRRRNAASAERRRLFRQSRSERLVGRVAQCSVSSCLTWRTRFAPVRLL